MSLFRTGTRRRSGIEQITRRLEAVDALCEAVRASDPDETLRRLGRLRYGHAVPAGSAR